MIGTFVKKTEELGGTEINDNYRVTSDGTIFYGKSFVEFTVGARISFGSESQYWRVLEINENEGKALLFADGPIINEVYNAEEKPVTWEKCSLRKWLNNDYLMNAFAKEERECIIKSCINNSDNSHYHTKGGNDTEDQLFLLSQEEAEQYFDNNEDRANGTTWWLRTPGRRSRDAAIVGSGGWIDDEGHWIDEKHYSVCPAFFIDLRSDLIKTLIFEEACGTKKFCNPLMKIQRGRIIQLDPAVEELIIPEFVTEIPGKVLGKAKDLRKITLSASVKKVDGFAFSRCEKIEKITVKNLSLKFQDDVFDVDGGWLKRNRLPEASCIL